MKILVLKRDKLGDLLLTSPMLMQLRRAYPLARIELLASAYNAWVADGHPALDAIHAYPRVRTGRRVDLGAALAQLRQFIALRRVTYDWLIVAQGEESPRAIERALWLKARRVVAYATRSFGAGLTDALPPPVAGHEAQRVLDLLTALDVAVPLGGEAPYFRLPDDARNEATAWLASQGLASGQFVVLGLGARRARKQPTTAQILRWVAHLWEMYGLKTVFMWTPGRADNPLYPGDDDVAQPVLAAGSPHLVPFRGPLRPAIGLVFQARTSLFPDSGLMHFASASPGGVLGLFGDTAEFAAKWAPLGARSQHLVAETVSALDDAVVFACLQRQLALP